MARSLDPAGMGGWGQGAPHTGNGGAAAPPGSAGRASHRLGVSLVCGIFLAAGLLLAAPVGREALRGIETFEWQERRCEITHAGVLRGDGEEPYTPQVRFHTLPPGPQLEGSQIRRGHPSYTSYGAAAARVRAYAPGAGTVCWASPSGELVLERGPLWTALWLLLPLALVAIGGGGLVATWRRPRTDAAGRPLHGALPVTPSRAGRVAALVGLGLASVGAALSWPFVLRPLAGMLDARSWEHRTCTVEHSSVVEHDSDDGTTWSVDILYRWERGRGIERSSRYAFFGGSSSGYESKAAIVRAHPVGAEVPCWVHPERRDEAVLERGLTATAFVSVVPLGFLAVGLGVLAGVRRQAARRARRLASAERGELPFPPGDPMLLLLPEIEPQRGPMTLTARSSPPLRFLGLVFAALFWNGIVAVFGFEAWDAWQRGRPEWGLTLFLVPFVVIGAGLVLAAARGVLALANPRPQIVVAASVARPGDRLDVQWSFRGSTARLESVRLVLRGREEASYQVGTETRTATEDFFERVLLDVPGPVSPLGGQASLTIPEDAMHSFESEHNKIVWQLELRGTVPRWPDVEETYPLVVIPGAAASGGFGS